MNYNLKICKKIILLPFLLFTCAISAQNDAATDTAHYYEQLLSETESNSQNISDNILNKKTLAAYYIVPSALITYGIATRFSSRLQRLDRKIDEKVTQNIHRQYKFDDYIQFAPYIGIYGFALCGVKAKHNLLDRTLVLAASMVFAVAAVQSTKYFTQIERPDGTNRHSFPSGHTTTAFLGAHILFREYKDASVWIGIAGYGVAAATASMRVINRKHWLSDVVTGAGAGILCAELGYLMLPVWHKIFRKKRNKKALAINPIIAKNNFGVSFLLIMND
jgi:membrane-associated phospholipid phosphatase